MLRFDDARFLRIQSGALALAPRIDEAIASCLAKGARNLFFLGTGGAAILMQPAAQLLQRRSAFPTYIEISAELVAGGHAALGRQSIVVIPSLSGTTAESVAALELAKAKGATVIALTGHGDTPLATMADHALVNFAEDDTSSESFYLQALLLALSLMHRCGELPDHAELVTDLARLPALLLDVKRSFEPQAAAFAGRIATETYHVITAAGSCWPQAFYYGMCILEEMQWIRTRPVHAADFFHGTLELVEPGVSVILLKGEDACRGLADRVERFALRYTDKLFVLDTAAFALPGLSPAARALVSPVVLATALERLSAHLEERRDHPLTTRRYYKRVDY
jgi:fructoselysine-6-phosphate deglycase